MKKKPTKRQQELLDFVAKYWQVNRYGPSIREIMDAMQIKNPNGVTGHLKILKRKGLIEWEPNCNRTLRVVEERGMPLVELERVTEV